MKYGKLDLGRIEAVVNKLGGMEGVEKFLSGNLTVSEPERSWREKDGIIYFSVTSDGTTGPKWIKRFEKKNFQISDWAKDLLRSDGFNPTNRITTEIAVLKEMLFNDNDLIAKKIRAEADNHKLIKPNAEVACLIRENFSDEEIEDMGLWWILIMHEPIKDSGGDPCLLIANRIGSGRWLGADCGDPDLRWSRNGGFAFVVSQVGSQN